MGNDFTLQSRDKLGKFLPRCNASSIVNADHRELGEPELDLG
jgi:hypothetical protein